MALGDLDLPIAFMHKAFLCYFTGIGSKTERPSLVNILALSGHEIYDLVFTLFVKLAGICVFDIKHIPREFNDCYLHPEADPEVRDIIPSRIFCGEDHAGYTSVTEASGYYDAVESEENVADIILVYLLGIDPDYIDRGAVLNACGLQRFRHR